MTPSSQPLRGAIVAMNDDRVIGIDGDLPWHYSADLKRFKKRTINHTIIMGRLTWESIGSKPLPGRRNVVISRSAQPQETAEFSSLDWYQDLELALGSVEQENSWIIGGGQLYAATMDWLNLIDVTMVPDRLERKDVVRFPEIDPAQWRLTEEKPLADAPTLINRIYEKRP